MAINKIIFGGETLIDLTSDTVDASHLLSGSTAHDKSGEQIEGTCTFDVDSGDATVAKAEILNGKTAYARGAKITGSMPNNGKVSGTISTKDGTYTVPQGYHDGSGTVGISATERAKIKPENIRENIVILGVTGTMSGSEGENKQTNKNVTPTKVEQTILPDGDYTCLGQVTVAAIPYAESQNSAGGITAIIAG